MKDNRRIFDALKNVFLAIFFALCLRAILVESFNIPSGSMIPSLLVGDYLFVSKYDFGYSRFSFPFGSSMPYFSGRVLQYRQPRVGEIIVFRLPSQPKTDYIKRVVGTPGDRVQMRNGVLYINGEASKIENLGLYKERAEAGGGVTHAMLYWHTLPNNVRHKIIKKKPFGEGHFDNTPEYTVPEGHIFVMGDNRDGSSDSRDFESMGFIPQDYLIGQAKMVFFSTDGRARWWAFWKWLPSIRFERFFNLIR